MDAAWRADAHRTMWGLAADPRLQELRDTARRIARDVITPALAAGAADSPVWTAAKSAVLDALGRTGLLACPGQDRKTSGDTSVFHEVPRGRMAPLVGQALPPANRSGSDQELAGESALLQLGLAAAELAVADGGAATCLLSGYLAHSIVSDFGTPEQKDRYLDRKRYPHGALCLTEPPPGAGVDALTLTGRARLVVLPGAAPMLDVEKRGRLISHMEFADFVLLAVDFAGGCLIVAEPSDEGLFDRGQPVRTLGHRLSSVTSPAFRLRVPASRILGGYTVEDGRLVPRVGYRQALEPALGRCRPVVALMTAGKLLATIESVLALGFGCQGGAGAFACQLAEPLPLLGWAFRPRNFMKNRCVRWGMLQLASRPKAGCAAGFSTLSLVDAWADAEAAATLAVEAARMSDRMDTEAAITGAAARLFATAHAAPHLARYAALPGVLGRIMDAQVEAIYLGAESVQRRQLAAAMAAPDFPSRLAAWTAETGASRPLRAALALLGWTLEFLRRARLLSDARQGAGFALADALCRLLAARALAAGVQTLRAAGSPCLGFFTSLSVAESAAAASAVAQVSTSLVFGYAAPAGDDLRRFFCLRAAVDAGLAGAPAARLHAAAFLLAEHDVAGRRRSIDRGVGPAGNFPRGENPLKPQPERPGPRTQDRGADSG